ncbi:response regulator transcription factor [Staphylococcus saprophyticus]|jgi:two-component system OmpR family response regulator|uniref:response regulator transcription factor n=1 Tax=Staphylococcus saprophyticus TaxID=29385 RepID=UPI00164260D3|nr:response regulator transcription factor [Staphylococcus saprophyticus]MBC2919837.1 response regulator transcription factor [Staphylococcus saprophyticus]MBC2957125.1 response regulator transcription factor [Staphylococcus saprophyticus]MBC3008753.1 response regulator transcription factor [Staphylococcus saprophyticus]MBC3022156.1 response regulator transcription factor [Staphylococcus saprophyticus]MBC3030109.1 response regulator transcription factor [Staphylococcus saprophyticus]
MITCLIVDDDPKILEYVSKYIEREHFETIVQSSAENALSYLETHQVDIAIVDVMMGKMSGFELCKILKEDFDIPVIMLTARDALSDKEQAYLTGTDDYVTKPFEVKELMFRIKAVLKRYNVNINNEVSIGNLTLNQSYLEIQSSSKSMNLPNKEFQLLFLLASNPRQVFNRDALIEKIWGFDYEGDERTVDVHIKRLRKRLEKIDASVTIHTVRGLGYKVDDHV